MITVSPKRMSSHFNFGQGFATHDAVARREYPVSIDEKAPSHILLLGPFVLTSVLHIYRDSL